MSKKSSNGAQKIKNMVWPQRSPPLAPIDHFHFEWREKLIKKIEKMDRKIERTKNDNIKC